MDRDASKQLELRSRRPLGGDVIHPDRCQPLTLWGWPWKVRPLYAAGPRMVPVFGDTGVTIQAQGAESVDPAMLGLAAKIGNCVPRDGDLCPTCKRPIAPAHMDAGVDFVCILMQYAGTLLRQQYTLDDEQLADLLTIEGKAAAWFPQVIRHSVGLPTAKSDEERQQEEFIAQLMAEHQQTPPEPQAAQKPRWAFWR